MVWTVLLLGADAVMVTGEPTVVFAFGEEIVMGTPTTVRFTVFL